jgi:hypothetical protein
LHICPAVVDEIDVGRGAAGDLGKVQVPLFLPCRRKSLSERINSSSKSRTHILWASSSTISRQSCCSGARRPKTGSFGTRTGASSARRDTGYIGPGCAKSQRTVTFLVRCIPTAVAPVPMIATRTSCSLSRFPHESPPEERKA